MRTRHLHPNIARSRIQLQSNWLTRRPNRNYTTRVSIPSDPTLHGTIYCLHSREVCLAGCRGSAKRCRQYFVSSTHPVSVDRSRRSSSRLSAIRGQLGILLHSAVEDDVVLQLHAPPRSQPPVQPISKSSFLKQTKRRKTRISPQRRCFPRAKSFREVSCKSWEGTKRW